MLKILIIFGTRPEAIKMAPIVKSLESDFEIRVCVTAQHREMLDQVLNIFEIKPDIDLDLMKHKQTLSELSSRILSSVDNVLDQEKPDLVLVHGDTTTSTIAALCSFYKKIDVGHVEAGLRTNEKYSPFPEEMNRQLTSKIASIHFAPTLTAKKNLLNEGIKEDSIHVTGNTVVDALKKIREKAKGIKFSDKLINDLPFLNNNEKIILVTGHRRENFGSGFEEICAGIKDIALEFPSINIVYPVHLNPNVLEPTNKFIGNLKNVHLIQPVEYIHFIKLMEKSQLIITDSGGIQEEAPSFSLPVLVMRDSTERPEAIESGNAILVGANRESIFANAKKLLQNVTKLDFDESIINPFGDGNASNKIKDILKKFK